MADAKNYLLGYGERLTEPLPAPKRPMEKKDPYSFTEARTRLAPRIQGAAQAVAELPREACPHDESVLAITIHPAYLAKSFFPTELLRSVGLEAVGSKPRQVIPDKGAKKPTKKQAERKDQPASPTTDLFVLGRRTTFERWATNINRWTERVEGAAELVRIEDVRLVPAGERVKPLRSKSDRPLMEVVLHRSDPYVLEGFRDYLRQLDVPVDLDRRIIVQELCFLPVRIPTEVLEDAVKFSFLRVAREMPQLRPFNPVPLPKVLRSAQAFPFSIEHTEPLDPQLRVAVFDGGLPQAALPQTLARRKVSKGLATAVPEAQGHGLGVTSAILFGPLEKGISPPQPFASVEHYRVIDENTKSDPQGHYFELLTRVMDVLKQKHFDFVNLSLGPDLPIEDDEVHVWTASLDTHFSHGNTLVTVAAGNTGEDDWDSGNARIQAPADGVNLLSVGAADSHQPKWKRASYSSIGPGRSPGLIKPDLLAFGGSVKTPFWVPDPDRPGYAIPIQGTSFASPLALRMALGIRTHLGPVVQPVALRALLIHHSDKGEHEQREVGWGRIPTALEELITCPDDTVHVLYQGLLNRSTKV